MDNVITLQKIKDHINHFWPNITMWETGRHKRTGGGKTLYLQFGNITKSWGKNFGKGMEEGFIELLGNGSIWVFTHWDDTYGNYKKVLEYLQPNKCGYYLSDIVLQERPIHMTETDYTFLKLKMPTGGAEVRGRLCPPRWVKKLTIHNYIETLSHYLWAHDKIA